MDFLPQEWQNKGKWDKKNQGKLREKNRRKKKKLCMELLQLEGKQKQI